MNFLSGISTKVLVIAFVVIVVMLVILMALFSPVPTTDTAIDPPPPVDVVTPDDPVKAEEHPYLGVMANDTLAVAGLGEKSLVISLDHRRWRQPKWSPDGKTIAVLGVSMPNSAESVYDLFVYTLANNIWKQITFYGNEDSGITGYDWTTEGLLVFTQGVDPNNWVHSYNLESGELRKLFRVNGTLHFFSGESGFYIIRTNSGTETTPAYNYELRTVDGVVFKSFNSEQARDPAVRLLHLQPGRTDNEFVIGKLIGEDEALTYDTWNLDNPQQKSQSLPLAYIALCPASSTHYWGYVGAEDGKGFEIISFSFASDDVEATYETADVLRSSDLVTVDSTGVTCAEGKALLPVRSLDGNNKPQVSWYLLHGDTLDELPLLQNFTAAVAR